MGLRYTPELLDTLQKRRRNGVPVRQLANELGVSRQWVSQLLRRAGSSQSPTRWVCKLCDRTFRSAAQDGPERCPKCRQYGWRSEPKAI